MRIYTIHERPSLDLDGNEYVFLRDGFVWAAFFAPPIWALHHRLWFILFVTLTIIALMSFLFVYFQLDFVPATAIALAILFLFSHHANDIRALCLQRRDFRCVGLIVAMNLRHASERFFSRPSFNDENDRVPL